MGERRTTTWKMWEVMPCFRCTNVFSYSLSLSLATGCLGGLNIREDDTSLSLRLSSCSGTLLILFGRDGVVRDLREPGGPCVTIKYVNRSRARGPIFVGPRKRERESARASDSFCKFYTYIALAISHSAVHDHPPILQHLVVHTLPAEHDRDEKSQIR